MYLLTHAEKNFLVNLWLFSALIGKFWRSDYFEAFCDTFCIALFVKFLTSWIEDQSEPVLLW